jgi:hypothetical protein
MRFAADQPRPKSERHDVESTAKAKSPGASVRCSVLVKIARASYAQIDIGIMRFVALQVGRSYFEDQRPRVRSILQVMSVGLARTEGGAIAGAEEFFAPFCNEDNLSRQNIHELLCQSVPMPLAGPCTRRQFQEIYADLLKSRRRRQPMSNFILTRRGERFRISRTG